MVDLILKVLLPVEREIITACTLRCNQYTAGMKEPEELMTQEFIDHLDTMISGIGISVSCQRKQDYQKAKKETLLGWTHERLCIYSGCT